MSVQGHKSAPRSNLQIVCLSATEKILLLLAPYSDDGALDEYLEFVSNTQRMKTGDGEDGVSVQSTYAEPKAKNAKPIMNYHY